MAKPPSPTHQGVRMPKTVTWLDGKREPKCEPNPEFPNGRHLDVSNGAKRVCTVDLEYPAQRCGAYLITCGDCGVRIGVTTAGRPDDPRSVKMACRTN